MKWKQASLLLLLVLSCAIWSTPGNAGAYPTGAKAVIYSPFEQNLFFNAQGCSIDTHVILFPSTFECGNGANEEWQFKELNDGYDVIYANYGTGGNECLNVAGGNYNLRTYIYAWQCNPEAPAANEEFRRPENTKDGYGYYHLVPGRQPNLNQFCLNAQGGLFERANIILWYCEKIKNESWSFG